MEWISVKDRLPEGDDDVLCYFDFRWMQTRSGKHVRRTTQDGSENDLTHWMPLPEPPVTPE